MNISKPINLFTTGLVLTGAFVAGSLIGLPGANALAPTQMHKTGLRHFAVSSIQHLKNKTDGMYEMEGEMMHEMKDKMMYEMEDKMMHEMEGEMMHEMEDKIDNISFDDWRAFMLEKKESTQNKLNYFDSLMSIIDTKEEFDQMKEMHKLRMDGKNDEAEAIRIKLGLPEKPGRIKSLNDTEMRKGVFKR